MKKSFTVLLMFVLLLAGGCASHQDTSEEAATAPATIKLNVSAAASLTDVVEELKTEYTSNHPNIKITYSLASSGTLQKQIEEGAPADLFISAGVRQMDALAAKDLIVTDSRKNILGNDLVLITPKDSTLKDFAGLTNAAVEKVSIGTPETVPAGKYAREALTSLKLYDKLQPKLVLAKDVRQVLTYVETGNVDAGLVYSSDTCKAEDIRIVTAAPQGSHRPIVYPMAIIKASEKQDAASDFAAFLTTKEASAIFVKYGFVPLAK